MLSNYSHKICPITIIQQNALKQALKKNVIFRWISTGMFTWNGIQFPMRLNKIRVKQSGTASICVHITRRHHDKNYIEWVIQSGSNLFDRTNKINKSQQLFKLTIYILYILNGWVGCKHIHSSTFLHVHQCKCITLSRNICVCVLMSVHKKYLYLLY